MGLLTTIVTLVFYKCTVSGQTSELQWTSNNGYTYLRGLPLSQLLKLQKSVSGLSQCSLQNTSKLLEERKASVRTINNESNEMITALPLIDGFNR